MESWRLGFLVPLVAAVVTAVFIIAIGNLLLAVGHQALYEFGETKVLPPVPVALGIAVAILVVSAFLARRQSP